MFKSIFAKYITIFVTVIIISFLILSTIITAMLNGYVADDRMNGIKATAETVKDVTENEIKKSGIENSSEALKTLFYNENITFVFSSLAGRQEKVTVVITDSDGKIVYSSDGCDKSDARIDAGIINELKENGIYKASSDDKSGIDQSAQMIYSCPITDSDGNEYGYVFVCAANDRHNALVTVMKKTVFMSSLWVMLAAIIAVYFMSDKTVSSLRSMVAASKKFASGEFDTRVEVRGHDEIAELSSAFNNMADSLEKIEKTRNTFLANVSHDLRTPMTSIAGFVDGILNGAIPPEKQNYYLSMVSDEIHRLSRMVSKLLDISRLESGARKFNYTSFDICEMSRLILLSFEQKIEDKQLDVSFETDDDPMMVYADKDAIHQVIYNLTENAVKFSKLGGKFEIQIRKFGDDKIKIIISDEGKTIPKEDSPFIFDRFYKVDKSRGLDNNGVGLGLYIVKTIIDAHSEEISVNSDEGVCTFEFTLKASYL